MHAGFSAVANITQLLSMVQLAESCHLAGLADTCLSLLARQLAAAGPFWSEQVQHAQLAACSSDSLARLACKMAGCVHAGAFQPPKVHGVRRGLRGAAGGFTWMLPHFSRQRGRVTSPWVEVREGRGGCSAVWGMVEVRKVQCGKGRGVFSVAQVVSGRDAGYSAWPAARVQLA
jgi:hypothetical protein